MSAIDRAGLDFSAEFRYARRICQIEGILLYS